MVGPHSDAIEPGVTALDRAGGVLLAADAGQATEGVRLLLDSPDRLRRMAQGAIHAVAAASQAAARSLEALERFGLVP